MDKFIGRLEAVLARAWLSIQTVDWTRYGSNIRLVADDGTRKYQGVMLRSLPHGTSVARTVQYGILPDPAKTEIIVGTKLVLLKMSPTSLSSLELRNPAEGKWGGGIRSSGDLGRSALSGLPEIADHVLLAHLMRHSMLLSRQDWASVLRTDQPALVAAMQDAGMTRDQLSLLVMDLFQVVEDADRAVPLG